MKTLCKCGNPEEGFECSCNHSAYYHGDKDFICAVHGTYSASIHQCRDCEHLTVDDENFYKNIIRVNFPSHLLL